LADSISRTKRTQRRKKIIAVIESHAERPSGGQLVAAHPDSSSLPGKQAPAVDWPRADLRADFLPIRAEGLLAPSTAHTTIR
jgi:hypothetical protein